MPAKGSGGTLYGKIFEDIFCSTLMDYGGDTAYVFMAMIVLSDERGMLKHNDSALARMICKPVEVVREAIRNLESPDANSNIKAQDGRRIVPLHELMNDETRGWLVVNKDVYRTRASKEDKRETDRARMAEKRSEIKDVASSRNVSRSVAEVAHTDTDANTESLKALDAKASLAGFEILWKTYPKRAGNNPKRKAESAYKARLLEKHTPAVMLDGASRYARFVRSTGKEGTEFVLQTATFLGKDKSFLQPWAAPNGQGSWDRTESATLAKGAELGLPARPGESMEEYRGRIRARLAS